MSDYDRIAAAIEFIRKHTGEQPSLEAIAAHVHLSPAHFQRLFSRWAGISPKRFLQQLTLVQAQRLLDASTSTLATSQAVGLSSSARLHDHFVSLNAVTPGEYKHGGAGLEITYGQHTTPYGPAFIACTKRGVCQLTFVDRDEAAPLELLRRSWPHAVLRESVAQAGRLLERIFGGALADDGPVALHVRGTNFQINVWRTLLEIPPGRVTSYGNIAAQLGRPGAARAVGNAVGSNPAAWLIPCHRVIRASGALGDYRWGKDRKRIMLALEVAGG